MKTIITLETAAKKYVTAWGKAIFPIVPSGKVPFTSNGFLDASISLESVDEWWRKNGMCNIGLPAGAKNGLIALDADAKHNGNKVLCFLKSIFPILLESPRSSTGGGGEHIYLKFDQSLDLSNKAGVFQGIDVKTEGGYVVVPPSIHKSGFKYEWITDFDTPLQDCPKGLLVLLKDKTSKNYIRIFKDGERNKGLFDLVMFLRRKGVIVEETTFSDVLASANQYLCEVPLTGSEVDNISGSLKKYKTETPSEQISKKDSNLILNLCLQMGTLFHFRGSGYIKFTNNSNGCSLPYLIQSREVKLRINQAYYKTYKKPASDASIKEALQLVEAIAIHESSSEDVFVRVASVNDAHFVDILDDEVMVKISKGKWELVPINGINFLRKPGMEKLAIPTYDQNFDLLKSDLFTKWGCWESPNLLILAWVIKSLTHDTGPYPILVLMGVQGSGKSFFSRYIKSLIDPNMASLRSCPRKEEDFILSTTNSHLIAVDNNSGLSNEQADWFCRLSTGGGFSVRKLYTNDEEHIIYAIKPILMNGINTPSSRGDFLERSIVVELPRIEKRESEKEILVRLERDQSKVLGSLLTLLAQASELIGKIHLEESPRMADFCTWGVAIEKILNLPEGTFLKIYKENQSALTETVLDSSPFAQALLAFIASRPDGLWTGANVSELLKALESSDYYPTDFQARKYWPNSPENAGKILNRISPALYEQGVSVIRLKREMIIKKESSNDYTKRFNKDSGDVDKVENVGRNNNTLF